MESQSSPADAGSSLGAQRGALFHAEAMLLIDHGQLQLLEPDRFLDDGMRADHNFDRAICQALPDHFLFGLRRVTDQQTDLPWLQDCVFAGKQREVAIMLFRKNGGG